MTETSNINRISNIDRYQQLPGNSGAPQPGDDKPQAVVPVDRVTLSAQALKKECGQQELDPGEKQQVDDLKQRDTEVKAHEQAHMASGGGLVQGGATYEYQTGPDGKMYAVGGEVSIDLSPERTPDATIRKMQQVRRAALAPSEPSGTDRAVAAQASQIEAQARAELTGSIQANRNSQVRPDDSTPASNRTTGAPIPYQSFGNASGSRIDLVI